MGKRAFTFPGQGSQAVGMGKELAESFAEARAVFDEVDQALGENLARTMFEGPDETLRLTENAQPALMAVSMAVVRVLEARGVKVKHAAAYVAGHSLGEYSALCAAGVFSISDAARLLRIRGKAMQQAVPVGQGAMAALLGAEIAQAEELAKEASQGSEICVVANDNAPGQIVISGHKAAIDRAAFSATRVVTLTLDAGDGKTRARIAAARVATNTRVVAAAITTGDAANIAFARSAIPTLRRAWRRGAERC